MADILMTYSSMETAANNIKSAKESLDNVIGDLQKAVSALEGFWSGTSYEAFKNAWLESKPTMERLSAPIGNFAPELEKAKTRQQEVEQQNAASMGKLAL